MHFPLRDAMSAQPLIGGSSGGLEVVTLRRPVGRRHGCGRRSVVIVHAGPVVVAGAMIIVRKRYLVHK
jgi:hypothetical protein